MTIVNRFAGGRRVIGFALVLSAIAVIGLAGILAIRAIEAQKPLLALGAVLAVPVALAVLAWPDVATLVVIFVLYTNAAVVAVKFHGVPYVVGAAVPLLLGVPLAYYLIARRRELIVTPVIPLIFLFVLIQLVGTVLAKEPRIALAVFATSVLEGLVLYFLITNAVRTPEVLRWSIWALLLAGAIMGGISLFQQITGTFHNDYGGFAQLEGQGLRSIAAGEEPHRPRLCGPIGEKNYYAQFMLMLVPLGLFRLWGERSAWLRVLAATATALAVAGCVLTFSRGAAVGFALMLVIMGAAGYIRPRQLILILLGAASVVVAVPQYRTRLASVGSVWNLMSGGIRTEGQQADSAIKGRVTENLAAVLVFLDHPVIGVGPGMFKYYSREYSEGVAIRELQGTRESHCLYLGLAANYGAAGLTCFMAIVLLTVRGLVRARRRWMTRHPELANLATGFMVAIAVYMTTGLFLDFVYVRYFWLMLGLAGAAAFVADKAAEADRPEDLDAQGLARVPGAPASLAARV